MIYHRQERIQVDNLKIANCNSSVSTPGSGTGARPARHLRRTPRTAGSSCRRRGWGPGRRVALRRRGTANGRCEWVNRSHPPNPRHLADRGASGSAMSRGRGPGALTQSAGGHRPRRLTPSRRNASVGRAACGVNRVGTNANANDFGRLLQVLVYGLPDNWRLNAQLKTNERQSSTPGRSGRFGGAWRRAGPSWRGRASTRYIVRPSG
jgi:hypothetical protein